MKIEFICGQSKITMDPTSISIESMMIDVNAQANLSTKASVTANHAADGFLNVNAPLVKIN